MIPTNLIQALIKSGAIQKLHSFSNANQAEEKTKSSLANLSNSLQDNTSETQKNNIQPNHSIRMDTVDLTSNDSSQVLHQQFTFQTKDFRNISLRMSGRKKNGKLDSTYCRLLFSFELKNLKETVIDVRVQNRILSIIIYNHTEGIKSMISELKSTLQTNLEPLGYQLTSVKVGTPIESDEERGQTDLNKVYERVDLKI